MPCDALAEFSRRNRIRRLALFGSALRDDFRPDSDLDILVEFEPDARVGLRFFALQRELTELLGRAVDLNTPAFLSPHFRDQVLAEAEDLYVAPCSAGCSTRVFAPGQ
jgi:predicted nucleotidyltransferase